ncbi:MAG: FAD-dependent oxidoreductase [Deltaproteobacteria bacterium]|nr:FAD-dependent oxidoreductase [Deltaproteobacteria bacterium]
MNDVSIVIIGGGVIGCAVARELSTRFEDVFLLERNPGITRGENQSSRNSGVIHSGIYYDRETRPLKAALCVEGNRLLYAFCSRHRVPALQTGKLIVASTEEEDGILDLYLERAKENGVPGVEKISGGRVRELEPNVKAVSALLVPSAGIVDPASLVYRLHTLAGATGVQFMAGTEVVGLEAHGEGVKVALRYRDGALDGIEARCVINAAGVEADLVARMLDPDSPYELDPLLAESYKFYGHKREDLALRGMNIYPTPEIVTTAHGSHFVVGIHLTPTFEDLGSPPRMGSTVTVGPRHRAVRDRNERTGEGAPARLFADRVRAYFPGLRDDDLLWHQAGIQARLKGYPDFIIRSDPGCPCCIHLLGIDSPGLTASLAVARHAANRIAETGILS